MKNIYLSALLISLSCLTFASDIKNQFLEELNEESVCQAVDFFYATNTSFTSTDIGWNPTPDAAEYVVKYRQLDDTIWYAVGVTEDSLTSLYSLDTCSGYEFYILTICFDLSELPSLSDTFYTSCDTLTSSIITSSISSDLTLYPNPTTGEINIHFDEPVIGAVIIKIYNGEGILQDERSYFLNGETELKNLTFMNFIAGLNYISVTYNGIVERKQLFVYR